MTEQSLERAYIDHIRKRYPRLQNPIVKMFGKSFIDFTAGYAAASADGEARLEALTALLRVLVDHAQGGSRRCWACGEIIENCGVFDDLRCTGAKARAALADPPGGAA